MKTDAKTLESARKLLNQLEQLENAQKILKNYDVQITARFSSGNNLNSRFPKEVIVSVSKATQDVIIGDINKQISSLKQELKKI